MFLQNESLPQLPYPLGLAMKQHEGGSVHEFNVLTTTKARQTMTRQREASLVAEVSIATVR